MYNQHTRGMATTKHRPGSLVGRGGRKALLETLHTQKKCQEKPHIHESKEKDSSTSSFQLSYWTISYEVIKATSIKGKQSCSTQRKEKTQ